MQLFYRCLVNEVLRVFAAVGSRDAALATSPLGVFAVVGIWATSGAREMLTRRRIIVLTSVRRHFDIGHLCTLKQCKNNSCFLGLVLTKTRKNSSITIFIIFFSAFYKIKF